MYMFNNTYVPIPNRHQPLGDSFKSLTLLPANLFKPPAYLNAGTSNCSLNQKLGVEDGWILVVNALPCCFIIN
jgi:hypothetical protein